MTFGPHLPARRAALAYCISAGIQPAFQKTYRKFNLARSKAMALAYENMTPDPLHPFVQASYAALAAETWAQWLFIKATGLKVHFPPPDKPQPYPSPRMAILDIVHNNHFYVTPTVCAFGTTPFVDDATNPLLAPSPDHFASPGAAEPHPPTLLNDVFRVVHDYFGHAKEGLGFRAAGEENAWRNHASMYTPLARRALAVELRGQNSWVNYGPFGEYNRTAGMDDTRFAPQKMGILPEWMACEGLEDPVAEGLSGK